MPKKMTQKKLTAKITKMEKGKSEAKIGDVAQILKAVKILLKKEALDFKSGKRKSRCRIVDCQRRIGVSK